MFIQAFYVSIVKDEDFWVGFRHFINVSNLRGHPYTTWSEEGEGVHEMTMNDHEGEGFRNDHVVRRLDFFRTENGCMNFPFVQHSLHA